MDPVLKNDSIFMAVIIPFNAIQYIRHLF